MPPHTKTVLRYQRGKLPLCHAPAKLSKPNGPAGVRDAISEGAPGRSEATAIHANGTAQRIAAPPAASSTATRRSALIMDAAFERAERDERQRQQDRYADDGRGGGKAGVVVLRGLLVDVIKEQVRPVGGTTLCHRHDVVDLGEGVEQRDRQDE